MRKLLSLVAVLGLLCATVFAQTNTSEGSAASSGRPNQQTPEPVQSSAPKTSGAPKGFVLQDGTPVRLRIGRTVSSSDAHEGETVDFEVLEDVALDNTLVIAKGGIAFATVTEAQAKRRMARGGKLDMNIDSVRMVTGEKAALRAVKEVKGGGHTGAMTGGIVATSLVFFPAAPFFLFMHGKDISIPKGTEITAYVSGDMQLDRTKFERAKSGVTSQTTSSSSPVSQDAPAPAQLELSSNPAGAEIEIDGNFVGSTPSIVGVTSGQHQIVIKKVGYKAWDRKITISSGNIKIDAVLELESKQ